MIIIMKNIADYFSTNKASPNGVQEQKSNEEQTDNSLILNVEFKNKTSKRNKKRSKRSTGKKDSPQSDLQLDKPTIEIVSSEIVVLDHTDENMSYQSDTEKVSSVKNAFQVMMESRNKSIGTNSPGKELLENNPITSEKSRLQARKKLLTEWAEVKGGAKRKQEEAQRDQIIKIKLEDRSKRMKKMLNCDVDKDSSSEFDDKKVVGKRKKKKEKNMMNGNLVQTSGNCDVEKKLKSIKTVPSNSVLDKTKNSKQKEENITLNKTVQKRVKSVKTEPSNSCIDKTKKSKHKENKLTVNEKVFDEHVSSTESNDKRKSNKLFVEDVSNGVNEGIHFEYGKTNKVIEKNNVDECSQESLNTPHFLRSWRMRIKLNLIENDESVIQTLSNHNVTNISSSVDSVKDEDELEIISSDSDDEKSNSVPKKIAPVFIKSTPKPKVDPEILKARQEFLMSGTPSVLKLKHLQQKSQEEKPYDVFPTVSHIQQKNNHPFWDLSEQNLQLKPCSQYNFENMQCKGLLNKKENKFVTMDKKNTYLDIRSILHEIKSSRPGYPVYKAFKSIQSKSGNQIAEVKQDVYVKKKRGRPKKSQQNPEEKIQNGESDITKYAMWTEKYKPKCSEDIIGNFESIKRLKTWLELWKNLNQNAILKKKRRNSSSSDFEITDSDSRDSTQLPDNTIILGGPCGSGKSTAVYAICNQLDFNVIELNASSKRTGKKLIQDLHEATQSHQVRKGEKGIENMFNSKKEISDSQDEKSNKKVSVLLVEDIDIVFDQDEGFIIALQQLIATSKRPIILTTTDYSSCFTQKFLLEYECISFSPLQSSSLATWCQILCLIEGKYVDHDEIASLIDYNKGDIRKTLLKLQYWVHSGGQLTEDPMTIVIDHQDDMVNDKMDDDDPFELGNDTKQANGDKPVIHRNCFRSFEILEHHEAFSVPFYLKLGFIWWNIPNIFRMNNYSKDRINKLKLDSQLRKIETQENSTTVPTETITEEKIKIRQLSNFLETLSYVDIMYRKYNFYDSMEPVIKNHTSSFKDSLELEQNCDSYKDLEFMHEVAHFIVDGHIKRFNSTEKREVRLNVGVPGKAEIRWRAKHHVCEDSFREALSPFSYVERKSVALDYYPTLRNISRSELHRADNNVKRGNRFRNYFKDLGIKCNENSVKIASKILRE